MYYNPFNGPIEKLVASDLAVLREVPEGWHIEYKREAVKAIDFAKAIAAMANTYGGWIFVGVCEKTKEHPTADAFVGIAKSELRSTIEKIRNGVANSVNPAPHYAVKVINGPSDELQLIESNAILVIEVRQSPTAPHLLSDGRVYRRVADSSQPTYETDRHFMDQLFRRREVIDKSTEEWVNRDPRFSEDELELGYLRLMFQVDPWMLNDPFFGATHHEVKQILNAKRPTWYDFNLDSVFQKPNGFFCRQTKGNDPSQIGLTLSFSRELAGELLVPLATTNFISHHPGIPALNGYSNYRRFIDIVKQHRFSYIRIIDLNLVFATIYSFVSKYRALLTHAGKSCSFYTKTKLLNIHRSIPFLDIDALMTEFEENGIPVSFESESCFPSGKSPEDFLHISDQNDTTLGNESEAQLNHDDAEKLAVFNQAYGIFAGVAQSLNLTLGRFDRGRIVPIFGLVELNEAMTKAQRIQETRMRRKID